MALLFVIFVGSNQPSLRKADRLGAVNHEVIQHPAVHQRQCSLQGGGQHLVSPAGFCDP